MQSFFTKFHSQDPWRNSPEHRFTPTDYRYFNPSPSILYQNFVKTCKYGSGCWFKRDGCRFSHPSASVPPKEAECLQIDRNKSHFGWVSDGSRTYDILNCAVSYNGHPISKKQMQAVMMFINSQDLTALIETHLCINRKKVIEVIDGMFLTMARIRDSDQASNQKELLSLFEEIKKKFGFTWFPLEKIKPNLQISFDSVDEFYKRVKKDVQAIQLHDYWKEQDEEDWKKYNKDILDSVEK